ncbi:hypothetical protein LTR37_002622 [Vermiconidia calcicola]|uniref:Uncharacterized protein n=1 Tax=Vermiconidia calcicola TaxID=1690605 RepID=A0ACC3NU13_9PEZI|nr:hypothetical protein LTR37_002622 [Vermiconidia calcicola]
MSRRDGNKRDATAPALFRIDTKNLSLSDARVLDGMIVEPFGLEEAVFRNHALHFEANGTMVESKAIGPKGLKVGRLSFPLVDADVTVEGDWVVVEPSVEASNITASFNELHASLSVPRQLDFLDFLAKES